MKLAGPLLMLMLMMLALPPRAPAQQSAPEDINTWPQQQLTVTTAHGVERFGVWIADNETRSEQGLMFQRILPRDRGMLFPQTTPTVMSMWMKNTLIPLDMLFIDADGRVAHIAANATPQSLTIISYPRPVSAVLELAGGECARRRITVGDTVALVGAR